VCEAALPLIVGYLPPELIMLSAFLAVGVRLFVKRNTGKPDQTAALEGGLLLHRQNGSKCDAAGNAASQKLHR
jgi:hypothetical protein